MEDMEAVATGVAEAPPDTGAGGTSAPETPPGTPEPQPGTEETPPGEEPAEPEPGPGDDDEGLGDVETEPEPGAQDAQVGRQISELKKTNPAAAKAWAKDHYSLNAYKQEFASVQEARSAKATLESLGGEDGINELTSEVGDYRNEIEQFSNGDPALLTQLYDSNPEALATAGSNLLQIFAERNPQMYDRMIANHISDRLASADVFTEFDKLLNAVKEGEGQSAWDTGMKIRAWFQKLQNFAKQSGEERQQQRQDPRAAELDRERESIASERAQMRDTSIRNDLNQMNMSATKRLVDTFFREVRLTAEGKKSFVDQLNSRIYALMKSDKTFQRNYKNIREKGDNARTARFAAGKFAELLPGQFKKLRDGLYPNFQRGGTKVATMKPNGAAPANGAASKAPAAPAAHGKVVGKSGSVYRTDANGYLIDKPKDIDVDRSKTDPMQWISGRGVTLTNGQVVNLNWRKIPR